jgi:hypothetical protein
MYFSYTSTGSRYSIARKILNHYKNIKNHFLKIATITFTILCSDFEISKKLIEDTIGIEYYYHFDQSEYSQEEFCNMLKEKYNAAIKLSIAKTPDILLVTGSDDFITFNSINQIINAFVPNIPQMYGIGRFIDNGTFSVITNYNIETESIDITKSFFWNGTVDNEYNCAGSRFLGGFMAVNKTCYLKYDFKSFASHCESTNELILSSTNDVEYVFLKDDYVFNIKCNSVITPFDSCISELKLQLIPPDNIDPRVYAQVISDISYFNKL